MTSSSEGSGNRQEQLLIPFTARRALADARQPRRPRHVLDFRGVAVVIEEDDPYEGTGFVRPLALASSKTFRTSLSKRIPVSSPSARASLTAYSSR